MFAVFMTAAMDAENSNHVKMQTDFVPAYNPVNRAIQMNGRYLLNNPCCLGIGPYGWIYPLKQIWMDSVPVAELTEVNRGRACGKGTKFRFSSGSLDFSEDV
jgi:hypothetical protein